MSGFRPSSSSSSQELQSYRTKADVRQTHHPPHVGVIVTWKLRPKEPTRRSCVLRQTRRCWTSSTVFFNAAEPKSYKSYTYTIVIANSSRQLGKCHFKVSNYRQHLQGKCIMMKMTSRGTFRQCLLSFS